MPLNNPNSLLTVLAKTSDNKIMSEHDRLEKLDIIKKVDGPTPFVSPIVVVLVVKLD